MIALEKVCLSVFAGGKVRPVLENCDFVFSDPRLLVLDPDPLKRSAVMGLVTGHRRPQNGRVRRRGRTSWAIGGPGAFRSALSGRETINFFCDMYDLRRDAAFALVADMLDVEVDLRRPVISWPSAAQMQLGYALALAPDFDIYAMDGPLQLAYPKFHARWKSVFERRVARRPLIVSTAQTRLAAKVARVGVVIEDKRLRRVTDVEAHLKAITEKPAMELVDVVDNDDEQDLDPI